MALTSLDQMVIDQGNGGLRTLMLCKGDLTALDPSDGVSTIAVSALPGDYSPAAGSLIGALAVRGVSVAAQAANKAASYEAVNPATGAPTMPCWVSQDVSAAGLNFSRFILFEPPLPTAATAPTLVQTIFRAVSCFGAPAGSALAVPMVSTGSGGADLLTILRMLFYAGAHAGAGADWPITTVKLVVFNDSQAGPAQSAFANFRAAYQNPPGSYGGGSTRPPGLTVRQLGCLRGYTGSTYYPVNAALRANNINDSGFLTYQPTIEAISSALGTLPDWTGQAQRGTSLPPAVRPLYTPGAYVQELSFTSSSSTSPFPGPDLLRINSGDGKSVAAYSLFPSENEILFDYAMYEFVNSVDPPPPGRSFAVTVTDFLTNWCNR
ncbi:MAG TPA: hypothetical protein VGB54_02640 [Allosphingosinicella sp.]